MAAKLNSGHSRRESPSRSVKKEYAVRRKFRFFTVRGVMLMAKSTVGKNATKEVASLLEHAATARAQATFSRCALTNHIEWLVGVESGVYEQGVEGAVQELLGQVMRNVGKRQPNKIDFIKAASKVLRTKFSDS
jgi:hypothetical protein